MISRYLIAVAGLAAAFSVCSAFAQSHFVSAPDRVDVVHDAQRDLVYISAGDRVLRYRLSDNSFLQPMMLGGNLKGIDISPSGDVLAVADQSTHNGQVWVRLVDLDSLSSTTVETNQAYGESGTFTVSFAADGSLYTTSNYSGSGWVPFRRLSAENLSWSVLEQIRNHSMTSASGNGRVVAFVEADSSSGPWGLYDSVTGVLVHREGYDNGTSAFNYEIATNHEGSQFAIPTYFGTKIYDQAYQHIATLGVYAGPQPIGIAYHPVEPLIYAPWRDSQEVRVFNANNFLQVGALSTGFTFVHNGNHAFQAGRTRLSRDGSLLMVTVGGGVRVIRQYAPLQAEDIVAEGAAGTDLPILLEGSIGNGGALTYEIAEGPAHGVVELDGNIATYSPNQGFSGVDSFSYRSIYGRAVADANVDVLVTASNQDPIARDDLAFARNHSVKIDVLENDSDADGDPLTLVDVTQPNAGSVEILRGGIVIFYPPRPFHRATSFDYTISDGNGGVSSATVIVRRY